MTSPTSAAERVRRHIATVRDEYGNAQLASDLEALVAGSAVVQAADAWRGCKIEDEPRLWPKLLKSIDKMKSERDAAALRAAKETGDGS